MRERSVHVLAISRWNRRSEIGEIEQLILWLEIAPARVLRRGRHVCRGFRCWCD